MNVVCHQGPSTIFDSLCPANSWKISPRCRLSAPKICFFRLFGMENNMILTIPSRMRKTLVLFHCEPLSLGPVEISGSQRPPYRSNLSESPRKAGAYLTELHWLQHYFPTRYLRVSFSQYPKFVHEFRLCFKDQLDTLFFCRWIYIYTCNQIHLTLSR